MLFSYTEKDNKYERRLYRLLIELKKNSGVLIGEPSLTKLSFFISGYEYAIIDLANYRLHFDKDFQNYINRKIPNNGELHWDQLLCENRTDFEAFCLFFSYLDSFFIENNIIIRDIELEE